MRTLLPGNGLRIRDLGLDSGAVCRSGGQGRRHIRLWQDRGDREWYGSVLESRPGFWGGVLFDGKLGSSENHSEDERLKMTTQDALSFARDLTYHGPLSSDRYPLPSRKDALFLIRQARKEGGSWRLATEAIKALERKQASHEAESPI